MRRNYILIGLCLAAGAYLYDVLNNLYDKTPLAEALVAVNWGRILFIGLLSVVVVRFLPDRRS